MAKLMAKLTILNVYKESEEISVQCSICEEEFLWSTINAEPDFCPMCGIVIDADTYTNPGRLAA